MKYHLGGLLLLNSNLSVILFVYFDLIQWVKKGVVNQLLQFWLHDAFPFSLERKKEEKWNCYESMLIFYTLQSSAEFQHCSSIHITSINSQNCHETNDMSVIIDRLNIYAIRVINPSLCVSQTLIFKYLSSRLDSSVGPGDDAKVKIYFTPTHSGLRKLVVDFDSNKLCHVKGYRNVIIGK